MSEVIFMIVMFACFTVPFALVGLWWWFWTMLAISLLVIIVEIISVREDSRTISQRFWIWSKRNKTELDRDWETAQ